MVSKNKNVRPADALLSWGILALSLSLGWDKGMQKSKANNHVPERKKTNGDCYNRSL